VNLICLSLLFLDRNTTTHTRSCHVYLRYYVWKKNAGKARIFDNSNVPVPLDQLLGKVLYICYSEDEQNGIVFFGLDEAGAYASKNGLLVRPFTADISTLI